LVGIVRSQTQAPEFVCFEIKVIFPIRLRGERNAELSQGNFYLFSGKFYLKYEMLLLSFAIFATISLLPSFYIHVLHTDMSCLKANHMSMSITL
jgi:hypothetical protein